MRPRVRHYGKPMSKFDIAYEIDRIYYSFIGIQMDYLSYDDLRYKLYVTINRYCPHRLCEFSNLF